MNPFKNSENPREKANLAFRGGLEPLRGDKGTPPAQLLRGLTTAKDDGDGAALLGERDYAGVVRLLDGRELSGPQANNLGIAYAHLALANRSGVDWQKADDALATSEKRATPMRNPIGSS